MATVPTGPQARACSLFDGLTDAELDAALASAELVTLADGECIVREGDVDTEMFVIASGRVRISQRTTGEESKTLAILPTWSFFGELALAAGLPRTADAYAVGETTLLRLTQAWLFNELDAGSSAGAKLCMALLQVLGPRLRQTNTELVSLYAAGRLMSIEQHVEALLQGMVQILVGSTTAKTGAVLMYNVTTDTLDGAAGYGYEDEVTSWSEPLGAGAAGIALGNRSTLTIEDWNADPRTKDLPVTGYERVTMLIVPLVVRDEPLGVFVLGDKMDEVGEFIPFRMADQVLVEGIAGMTAAGIANARHLAELREKEKLQRKYIGQ